MLIKNTNVESYYSTWILLMIGTILVSFSGLIGLSFEILMIGGFLGLITTFIFILLIGSIVDKLNELEKRN